MTSPMVWERVYSAPFDGSTYTTAEYRFGSWTATREHYAHGASLYEWVLTGPRSHHSVHRTLGSAKRAAALACTTHEG